LERPCALRSDDTDARNATTGTPAKWRIHRGNNMVGSDLTWAYPQPEKNPYQLEWDDLIDAIRKGKPCNEARRGAEASLVTPMGRRPCTRGNLSPGTIFSATPTSSPRPLTSSP
jgi:hypothetical protein